MVAPLPTGIRLPMPAKHGGFTLIELAVVIVVIALLLGSILVPLTSQVEQRKVLETQKSAIQLRYLQTLTEIGVEKNTTIVFPLPIDIINSWVESLGGQKK